MGKINYPNMTIKDEIIELSNKGYTIKEIGKMSGYTSKQIYSVNTRYGIKANRYKKIEMTEELEQFLIGGLLGDLSFDKIHTEKMNSRISIAHSLDQEDYIKYKHFVLSKYNLDTPIRRQVQYSDRYISGKCEGVILRSISHPIFTEYRNKYYSNKGKRICYDLIKKLNPYGLAIWFMDDGNVTNHSFQLNTQSFYKNEIKILQKVLKDNFNINSTVNKAGAIYILSESRNIFIDLIFPYIIDSMKYKLTPYKFRV